MQQVVQFQHWKPPAPDRSPNHGSFEESHLTGKVHGSWNILSPFLSAQLHFFHYKCQSIFFVALRSFRQELEDLAKVQSRLVVAKLVARTHNMTLREV